MTVEEAEKLMCPFGQNCITFKCMAWRWNLDVSPSDPRLPSYTRSKVDGYCGLAGKEGTD